MNFFSRTKKKYCGVLDNPMASVDTSKEYKEGKILFQNKCASCHSLYKDIVGPALIGFTKRGPWTDRKNVWLYLQNPMKFNINDNSGYMKGLREKYKAQSIAFLLSEKRLMRLFII